MRKTLLVVPVSLLSLSLLASAPAHTAGEVPQITYPSARELCTATSTELIVKAPAGAAVEGVIFEVDGGGPQAPFSLPAGGTAKVAVKRAAPVCTSTNVPNRKFRVLTAGAPAFEITVAAESVRLEAKGEVSNATLGIGAASVDLFCGTGAIAGEAEVKTGATPPAEGLLLGTVDGAVLKVPLKSLVAQQTRKVTLRMARPTSPCSAAHTLTVGIETPASTKTLTPVSVFYRKVPLPFETPAGSPSASSAR